MPQAKRKRNIWLKTNDVVAHTGDLVPYLTIDGNIGYLSAGIKTFSLSEECFAITDAFIKDADVSLVLNQDDGEESSDSTALAIDLEHVSMENVRFSMEQMALMFEVGRAEASALIDVGADCYTVRSIDVEDSDFGMGDFEITVGGLSGDVSVDLKNSIVSSGGLTVDIPDFQVDARLHETYFDMNEMRVTAKAEGSLAGLEFSLDADYGIDGNVTGPVDDFLADVDINVLPQTGITYPIDKKNLAQVSPSGTVNVKYGGAA